jgi:hypothetical protein
MIQVILTKTQLDLIGDLRNSYFCIESVLILAERGKMTAAEALKKIKFEIEKTGKVWKELTKEGV